MYKSLEAWDLESGEPPKQPKAAAFYQKGKLVNIKQSFILVIMRTLEETVEHISIISKNTIAKLR